MHFTSFCGFLNRSIQSQRRCTGQKDHCTQRGNAPRLNAPVRHDCCAPPGLQTCTAPSHQSRVERTVRLQKRSSQILRALVWYPCCVLFGQCELSQEPRVPVETGLGGESACPSLTILSTVFLDLSRAKKSTVCSVYPDGPSRSTHFNSRRVLVCSFFRAVKICDTFCFPLAAGSFFFFSSCSFPCSSTQQPAHPWCPPRTRRDGQKATVSSCRRPHLKPLSKEGGQTTQRASIGTFSLFARMRSPKMLGVLGDSSCAAYQQTGPSKVASLTPCH